ncbi:MAG: DUF2889 domain-containing protein [Syntrophales bacterium]|nr:DUF2889 domain-containing protein [Syntrophales bacterium]
MKERLHSRTITIETFDVGKETILVEGSLVDERFQTSRSYTGNETMPPGFVHDLVVRMTLSLPKLKIIKIEAEMPVVPHTECPEIRDAVEKLRDMEIKHGFSDEVHQRFGKTQGCIHMLNLILSMGSAAVQGMWSYYARKEGDKKVKLPDVDGSMLLDSCWVWRQGGPYAKGIMERKRIE